MDCKLNLCQFCEVEHKGHKAISFENIKQYMDKTKNKLPQIKSELDLFNKNIKEIIKCLNEFVEEINLCFQISNGLIDNYDLTTRNYYILQNIKEMSINNSLFEKIKTINESKDIYFKMSETIELYKNRDVKEEIEEIKESIIPNSQEIKNNNDSFFKEVRNEFTIIYNVPKDKDTIVFFGKDFVKNNKNNCYLLIDDKKHELCHEFTLNKEQKEKDILQIELIQIEPLTNLEYMFFLCQELKSLPDLSKLDTKNVTSICSMFNNCNSLTELPDISNWDTKNVTNMGIRFLLVIKINSRYF